MRQRIISALIGLAILAVVFVFLDTVLLNVVIGVVCIMAVTELLKATGCTKFRALTVLSVIMTLMMPFARHDSIRPFLAQLVFVLIVAMFLLMLHSLDTMRVEHAAMALMFSTVIPLFFSCAVYMRDDYGAVQGGFYMLVALGSAWLCDSGAYFVGIRFGKHKLAPKISPKKTVEGAVGGIVSCVVFMLLLAFGYDKLMDVLLQPVTVNYLFVALLTPVFAVAGMVGDLTASVIKRQFGVKDYGTIMPGHGGVMDRFDSVMLTLPCVYIAAHHVALIV